VRCDTFSEGMGEVNPMYMFYFLIGLGVGICLGFIVTTYVIEKWWFK